MVPGQRAGGGGIVNVLAIVPARGGSKGIPNKNLALCAGKPLIEWTLEAAAASQVNEIVVSTDILPPAFSDALTVGFGHQYHMQLPIADDAQIEDRLREVIRLRKPDIIALLQPTSPVRTGKQVDEAIQLLIDGKYDSVVSVVRSHSLTWEKTWGGVAAKYDLTDRPRRQDMNQYEENGSIYVFTREHWERTHNRLGGKIGLYEMAECCRIQVDTPFDLFLVEQILLRQTADVC